MNGIMEVTVLGLPFLRQNNWKTRNLALAGNFNMTNVDELFGQLTDLGQHPKEKSCDYCNYY